MKKIVLFLFLLLSGIVSINAQEYITVTQVCPYCGGVGGFYTPYGISLCMNCGGRGFVYVTVPNPNYGSGSNVSFDGHSHYTKTSHTVNIKSESGNNKGDFYVYLHDGDDYIYMFQTYIKIEGKSRFWYNGNWYIIHR